MNRSCENIAKNLRKLLEKTGKTIEVFSGLSGIPVRTFYNYLNGKNIPSFSTLDSIVTYVNEYCAMDIEVDDLLV